MKKQQRTDKSDSSKQAKLKSQKFKSRIQQYNELKSKNKIPIEMQTKLDFLLKQCIKQPKQVEYVERLQQQQFAYEKQQIDLLGNQQKVQLFNRIIKCLSGQQKIVYFKSQKVYFFKEKMFSKWATNVYLTFDSDFLIAAQGDKKGVIKQNSSFLFKIPTSLLKVSKKTQIFDKKIVFWVMNLEIKTKHIIGFKNHVTCQRLHSLLLSNNNQKGNQRVQDLLDLPEFKKMENNNSLEKQQNQVQPPINQLSQLWQKAQKLFEQPQYELTTNHLYSNLKNLKEGSCRLLIHNTNKNRLKFISLIHAEQKDSILVPSFALEHYIGSIKQWNTEIQTLDQIKQENDASSETKLYHVKFKRYSMMSYQRQAIFEVQNFSPVRINGFIVSYLLIYPVIQEKSLLGKLTSTLRAQVRQIVQIKRKINQNVVFFTVLSEIDFKGHNSQEDKKNMNCKVLNQLQNFQEFMKKQKCPEIKQQSINQIVKQKKENQVVKQSQRKTESVSAAKKPQEDFRDFLRVLQKNNLKNPTGQTHVFLNFLSEKIHERYYLKHRFVQSTVFQPNRLLHCTQAQGNFMVQTIKNDKKRPAWKINQNHLYQSIDYDYIEANKGVGAFIIKQVGSNLLSGKSIINISLPVQIFDYCSNMERIAYNAGFTAKYIAEASLLNDPLQQMKKIVLMVISYPSLAFSVKKPFNPILGQTFQCKIAGISFCLEQISHHPPITAYLMKTQAFQFYGQSQAGMNLGFNVIFGKEHRMGHVKFKNTNTHFKFVRLQSQFNGVMYGPKTLKFIGKDIIHQVKNNLHAQCSLGSDSKKVYESQGKMLPNDVVGGIFKVSPKYTQKYFLDKSLREEIQPIKPNEVQQKLVSITGNWSKSIYFNGKEVKKLLDPAPNMIEYQKYVLPSDCNFRQDLIYRKLDDFKKSQQVKEILQNIQRRDRKLRQKYQKKNK